MATAIEPTAVYDRGSSIEVVVTIGSGLSNRVISHDFSGCSMLAIYYKADGGAPGGGLTLYTRPTISDALGPRTVASMPQPSTDTWSITNVGPYVGESVATYGSPPYNNNVPGCPLAYLEVTNSAGVAVTLRIFGKK